MEKPYCENCGSIQDLACYDKLKAPNDNLVLCEDCADLPIKKITRKSFGDDKIILRDLKSA